MNFTKKAIALIALLGLSQGLLHAQTDSTQSNMLSEIDKLNDANNPKSSERVSATFKGIYIQNFQSVENIGKGVLQIMFMHRFGRINQGAYEFFGLDNATTRFGLDYGVTKDLMVSLGRSSYGKSFDLSAKYKVLAQTQDNKMPVTLSVYPGLTFSTLKQPGKDWYKDKHRFVYFAQALLARKFNENFSAQIIPTFIHYNLVATPADKNDIFAVGIGGRYKLTKRLSINAEYSYMPDKQVSSAKVYNGLSVGVDLETGGHVFQFIVSNSRSMTVPGYVAGNTDSWRDGGIFFGFNLSRVF
ncbi:hypothetical protein DBR32_03570 [Taibaiella sp. KBW10]|uniref:DUF5777 family beta-barrel protein n=1 Tax=Taibaiella sp. KBW10 TaxID=2153357 RepID=UPI000F5AE9A8|nr:DUF5777 family beta-barrel protein [Taibaiella sp. KBW10]RQO31896.1 hypothetical protein DBR32_03570 [Taibaiella sp. KBW10]